MVPKASSTAFALSWFKGSKHALIARVTVVPNRTVAAYQVQYRAVLKKDHASQMRVTARWRNHSFTNNGKFISSVQPCWSQRSRTIIIIMADSENIANITIVNRCSATAHYTSAYLPNSAIPYFPPSAAHWHPADTAAVPARSASSLCFRPTHQNRKGYAKPYTSSKWSISTNIDILSRAYINN